MKTTEPSSLGPALRPFLVRAASAGVVSGCGVGLGQCFDSVGLAVVAVGALHESPAAVDSRLKSARGELEMIDKALADEPEPAALPDSRPQEPVPSPGQRGLARLFGWFRRRLPGPTGPAIPGAEHVDPAVSRAALVRKIHELETRRSDLLAFEADYTGQFQAEYNLHRARVAELPPFGTRATGGE